MHAWGTIWIDHTRPDDVFMHACMVEHDDHIPMRDACHICNQKLTSHTYLCVELLSSMPAVSCTWHLAMPLLAWLAVLLSGGQAHEAALSRDRGAKRRRSRRR